LSNHLNSGEHEESRYDCKECNRQFKSQSTLQQHLNNTGHADHENRLVHTAIHDSQQSNLLLTNGSARPEYEATLYFDGGARPNPGRGGAGFWIYDNVRQRILIEMSVPILQYCPCTSNQAEYIALILGFLKAQELSNRYLEVKVDSEFAIGQMEGYYVVNDPNISKLYDLASTMAKQFQGVAYQHIRRTENWRADQLASATI
jgi:ribonuclease HI